MYLTVQPDEPNLKMLNMTLVLVKTRTEVFEERVFTGKQTNPQPRLKYVSS
jgi:hypothetical protein